METKGGFIYSQEFHWIMIASVPWGPQEIGMIELMAQQSKPKKITRASNKTQNKCLDQNLTPKYPMPN